MSVNTVKMEVTIPQSVKENICNQSTNSLSNLITTLGATLFASVELSDKNALDYFINYYGEQIVVGLIQRQLSSEIQYIQSELAERKQKKVEK